MNGLNELYKILKAGGYYSKSYDDFEKQAKNPDYQNKVMDVLQRDGLWSDEMSSLLKQGGLESPKKKAIESMVQGSSKKKDITTASSLADGSLDSQESFRRSLLEKKQPVIIKKTEPTEEDYFKGAFGDVLRGFDNVVPLGIGDFIDDMARSASTGYLQGVAAVDADKLLLKGTKATPEQIENFVKSQKELRGVVPSAEMQDYQKIYEQEGKGFWGVVRGLATNPTVIPEVLVSSLTAMATNTDALAAGAAAIGTGAGIGAAAGAPVGGVGAAPGALAGATASLPYAFGLASSVVEAGSTFGEILTEELGGKEMTKENVRQLLEDQEKLNSIRNKAIARGLIIGTVDAFTGKLASGVGAKIIGKGAATREALTKATAAGAAIESLGGAGGEAAARAAIGQEMDISEISLEGLADLPGGIRSTIQARLAKPSYKINGATATKEDIDNIINTMSPTDLAKTKIDIENDYEGLKYKIQDKITTHSIKEQVRQGNPELNEPSLNAITELEKELKKLEGNTTQTGKDRASSIRTQIKNIQQNQIQEEVKAEVLSAEEQQQRTLGMAYNNQRIADLEKALAQPDNGRGTVMFEDKLTERSQLEKELETIKIEQNAIQEQAAGQVPVQPTTGGRQEMAEGVPQPKLEITPEQEERKTQLQEAIAQAGEGVAEITIGEEVIPMEQAQAELTQLTQQIVSSRTPNLVAISAVSEPDMTSLIERTTDEGRKGIVQQAQTAVKTLKSILPDFDIFIHEDEASYDEAMKGVAGKSGSGGNFAYGVTPDGNKFGRIDINLGKANNRTVAHEVAHGVLSYSFGEAPDVFTQFKEKLTPILDKEANQYLDNFIKRYKDETVRPEEFLTEMTGLLSNQQAKLSVSTLQKIAALINEFVSKITNGKVKVFEDTRNTKDIADFFNTVSQRIKTGEAIAEAPRRLRERFGKEGVAIIDNDIKALKENFSAPIGEPVQISKSSIGEPITFKKEKYPLSFVSEEYKVDIDSLINEIIEKKQKVWFWMADQLGRGYYFDETIGDNHYLDAGPSFALDPENIKNKYLWASGAKEKTLNDLIGKSDYIFFISGSPEKAKLYNKAVIDLIGKRIDAKSSFKKFKNAINKFEKETNELITMRDILNRVNSFDELKDDSKRKDFLLAIEEIKSKKTAPPGSLKELLNKFNVFVDLNALRDGFYRENAFKQNDIMLIGKPTGLGDKTVHGTYLRTIIGDVVGVPDKKINSWDLMPNEIKSQYGDAIATSQKTKVIAAEAGIVREGTKEGFVKSKAQLAEPKLARDISVLITPATVRGFDQITNRIKSLSLKYDKLIKAYGKNKTEEQRLKIKQLTDQILNDIQQDVINQINNIPGVAVKFGPSRIGLWEKKFEPSFNMTLSVSPQADTKQLSDFLHDFSEKYSQDAFILETDSELNDKYINGEISLPLTEFDADGLTNFPQVIYTFAKTINDEDVAELSNELQRNGIGAFNINNNELKISVLTFLSGEQTKNLSEDEQYAEKFRDFESKADAAETSVGNVLGRNALNGREIVVKKSHYEGAVNEKTKAKTRKYNRRDILKPFQSGKTKAEGLTQEFAQLRQKQIDGQKLTDEEQKRFDELEKTVQPFVEKTFEANKKLYEQAKDEVESIAKKSIEGIDASISPFPIKRPGRASVKTLRWYSGLTEKLGDGARVNIIVKNDDSANSIFDKIDEGNPVAAEDKDLRRINETTDLGYPKRLIEIRTPSGVIAEMQVITEKAYLAKDGMRGFTGDDAQKESARNELDRVRERLGWNIPDGLGHYFYEINRDSNVPEFLRDEAKRLSNIYYEAFTNDKSKLKEAPFMKDVMSFKSKVDAADKTNWDKGNEGKAPESLTAKVTSKAQLPAELEISDGWYSSIEKKLLETKIEKQSANKWLTGDAIGKGDEATYTGVRQWLESKNPQEQVSKKDIIDWMRENRVEVKEIVKGAKGKMSQEEMDDVYNSINEQLSRTNQPQEIVDFVQEKLNNWYDDPSDSNYETLYFALGEINLNLDDFIEDAGGKMDDTRYYNYQLPGDKTDYKEVLVTLPGAEAPGILQALPIFDSLDFVKGQYGVGSSAYERVKQDAVIQLSDKLSMDEIKSIFADYESKEKSLFKSSHFDEPNILVHLRMNTRTDADGNKVLFIEEVQSDWGQEGKKEGFEVSQEQKIKNIESKIESAKKRQASEKDFLKRGEIYSNEIAPLESELIEAKGQNRITKTPTAPFVTDTKAWTKLGLKTALKEAVAQDVDKIAWTTGEQQNERYDLSKQVDGIKYRRFKKEDSTKGMRLGEDFYSLSMLKDQGMGVDLETGVPIMDEIQSEKDIPESKLESYVGKELAKKIIDSKDVEKTFTGVDLKVGGKGMKGFYDKIVPDAAKSLVKELTGKEGVIGETLLKTKGKAEYEVAKNTDDIKRFSKRGDSFTYNGESITKQRAYELIEMGSQVESWSKADAIQQSIDISPELKAAVERGMPLFSKAQLTEEDLPGYDRMMGEVEGIIEKSKKRGVFVDKILDNVIKYVRGSKVYEIADDIQREQIERDVRIMFGKRDKSAPSFAKIFGVIKDTKKITMSERELLKKQIRDLARGARDAKKAMDETREDIASALRGIVRSGKLSSKQAATVLRKYSRLNLLKPEQVTRFVDYMAKVFADADYKQKLSTANSLKGKIAKLSKDKEKNANLRDMATEFVKIDPSLVDDINEYNSMASKIKEALEGSKVRGADVKFAETVSILGSNNYINATLDAQEKKMLAMLADEINELLGIDTEGMTYEELKSLIESDKPTTKYNEQIVRDLLSRSFDINSSIIKSMIENEADAFTDYPVSFSETEKDIITRFMKMDPNKMSIKDALKAVDALSNFIQNKSTAGMESVVSKYEGEQNLLKLKNKGIKGIRLRKYFVPSIGRLLTENFLSLPAMFERIFKGVNRSRMVMEAMGLTKMFNGKAQAESMTNAMALEYVKSFYDKKANGEAFNTERNDVERGVASFMMRNVIGTEAQMKKEFERRKRILQQSIEALREGNELEQKKAELYEEAYNKIVEGANNIQDIKNNIDPVNLEAINFWIEKWAEHYDEMADVSLNVYNRVLGKDINFNPDRFRKVSTDATKDEISDEDSPFDFNNGTVYTREAGSLMKAVRPDNLPKNRYIDLSFDSKNVNSMYDALVDIKTAAAIRKYKGFMSNTKEFNSLFPDADIVRRRIKLYVDNIRKKNAFKQSDTIDEFIDRLNKLSKVGVSLALSGVGQPIKQVIPVAVNTAINAGGLDLGSMFDKSKRNFIKRSGYAIANRGVEALAQIESLNGLIEQAAETKGEKLINLISKINDAYLKALLVNPDAFIARSSWLSYYEQSLKKQGIDVSGIDYDTHEVNNEAADYAQQMVDRQQNISDPEMGGAFFTSKDKTRQMLTKWLMPFASFRINQSARLANDLSVFEYWNTSTKEDKIIAIRSLGGYAAENLTFKAIAAGISILLGSLVVKLRGDDEDDDEYQKRIDNAIKAQATGTASDLLSPLPIYDKFTNFAVYQTLNAIQAAQGIEEKERINIYDGEGPQSGFIESIVKGLGTYGIAAERAIKIGQLIWISQTGEFTDEKYGKKMFIKPEDREILSKMIVPQIVASLNLIPGAEINNVVNKTISAAKRDASSKDPNVTTEDDKKREKKVENIKKVIRSGVLSLRQRRLANEMIKYNEEMSKSFPDEDYLELVKNEKENEKKELERLLGTYSSREEMESKNKKLYELRFGENSAYYRRHRDERILDKYINDVRLGKKLKKKNWND